MFEYFEDRKKGGKKSEPNLRSGWVRLRRGAWLTSDARDRC